MLSSYMAVGWDGRFEVQEYIDADPEVVVVWRMTRLARRAASAFSASASPTLLPRLSAEGRKAEAPLTVEGAGFEPATSGL